MLPPAVFRAANKQTFFPLHLFFSFFQVYKFKTNRKAHNMQNNNKPFLFFGPQIRSKQKKRELIISVLDETTIDNNDKKNK